MSYCITKYGICKYFFSGLRITFSPFPQHFQPAPEHLSPFRLRIKNSRIHFSDLVQANPPDCIKRGLPLRHASFFERLTECTVQCIIAVKALIEVHKRIQRYIPIRLMIDQKAPVFRMAVGISFAYFRSSESTRDAHQ